MSRNQALATAAAVLLCLSGIAALLGGRPYARRTPRREGPLSAADTAILRQYNERQQYSLRQQHYERQQRQQYKQGMRLITERKCAARPTPLAAKEESARSGRASGRGRAAWPVEETPATRVRRAGGQEQP